jgi:uncharacterized protein (TIGR02246 family)
MVRRLRTMIALLGLALASCSAPLQTAPPAHDETCLVWEREVSFASSVRDHDARGFAEHVLPGALFLEGDGKVLRGRDAIVEGWKAIIRGEGIRLEWHPTSVIVTGDPRVALSRGPYWYEVTKPDAKHRFMRGLYQSTWVRDGDGVWRVAIDGGTPPPAPATEEEIQKLRDSLSTRCPTGS